MAQTWNFGSRVRAAKGHEITVHDRQLATLVQRCRDVPGARLFQYRGEDGNYHCIHADDVNQYLRQATKDDFSAKDFRTWAGTLRYMP
jgi:DNA topoisomerase-1